MVSYEGTPAAETMPADQRNNIIRARLAAGDTLLLGADTPPGRGYKHAGYCISLDVNGVAEAERTFAALSEGAYVQMPMGQTFFAERFG